MNAAITGLLLLDVVGPRRALSPRQQPEEPQIRRGSYFIRPEEPDERNETR